MALFIGLMTRLSSHKDATRVGMTKVEYKIISPHKFATIICRIERSPSTNNTLQLYSYFKYFNRLFWFFVAKNSATRWILYIPIAGAYRTPQTGNRAANTNGQCYCHEKEKYGPTA